MLEFEAAAKAVEGSIGVLDKLGLLERVQRKLISNPDTAATKLDIVFKELQTSYLALDHVLVDLCSLMFDDKESLREARKFLSAVQGGALGVELEKAHGHCKRIRAVYENHLTGWFSRVLAPLEAMEMKGLFEDWGDADERWVWMMKAASADLGKIALRILERLDSGDVAGAQQLVNSLLHEMRGVQRTLSKHLQELIAMQTAFREMSLAA